MKNEQWFQEVIHSLKEIKSSYWKGFEESTFHFSPLYRVAIGADGASNIPYLFGRSVWGRWRNHFKNLRSLKSFSFKAPLPSDSIIFLQQKRKRFIIVSRKENLALKISVSEDQLSLLKFEVELMSFMNQSAFSQYSIKLLDHGTNWIINSFAPNRDALINKTDPELFLLKHINHVAMDPMGKFYEARGIEKLDIQEWLQEARKRAEGHPRIDLIEKVIKHIEIERQKLPHFQLLKVQLHMDLHARNILFDQGDVRFIDWEVTTRGLAIVDYFDFYRRILKKDKNELVEFLSFLKGEGDKTHLFKQFGKDLKEWHLRLGVNLSEDYELIFILLYSLERTLIYFEKWGENRLKDKKGFEFLIANTL